MTSSIECECAVLVSYYDKDNICSSIILFSFWIFSMTYLITADKSLLSAVTWWKYSSGNKNLTFLKWICRGLHQNILSPFLNASYQMKNMHAPKTQTVIWSISKSLGDPFFSTSLDIWHHPLNVNVLSLCHTMIRTISALV